MRLLIELLATVAAAQDAKVDFESGVLPVLRARCFSCHEAATTAADGRVVNPKAGLRLDGRGWILRGSDERAVLVPGDPSKSRIYTLTVLPADHEERMPAKGDPLTKAQSETLRLWIVQGASFGTWTGSAGGKADVPAVAAKVPVVAARLAAIEGLSRGVSPASAADLDRARRAGATVTPAIPGSPLLEVSFVARESATGDRELAELSPLAGRITRLDLGRTKVTDAGLQAVASFVLLTRLDLHGTAVSDAGLVALKGLTELRSLNLFGTAVTDAGLGAIEGLVSIEDLYLRDTKVTPEGFARLEGKLPQAEIRGGFEAPAAQPGPAPTGKKKKKK